MDIKLILLASAAFACAALAVVLWQLAAVRAHRASALRRLGARLATEAAASAAPSRQRGPRFSPLLAWSRRLDLTPGPGTALLVLAPAPVLAAAVGAAAGRLPGGIALVLFVLLTVAALAMRREHVQRRLVRALPGFIDAMVRTITLGQSPAASFQVAVQATGGPLRRALVHAEALVTAGLDLDVALTQTGRMHASDPLLLLGSVMRMTMQYGGRADQVLERVAGFLRDREEAEQELVAASAETRMSAWVLGLLPLGVTVLIMVANAGYLTAMWNDPSGRNILFGAFALELTGGYLLYRLARFR